MKEAINKVIEEEIRPYLAKHYGDVQYENFQDGVLSVKLLGQCKGCPSAKITLEEVIEANLKEHFPQIDRVELSDDITEDMYNIARRLLNKDRR